MTKLHSIAILGISMVLACSCGNRRIVVGSQTPGSVSVPDEEKNYGDLIQLFESPVMEKSSFLPHEIVFDTGVFFLRSIQQVDNSFLAFQSGRDLDRKLIWNDGLTLQPSLDSAVFQSARFVSRVIDAGGAVDWKELKVKPHRPYSKELPDFGGEEIGYRAGSVKMGGNELLLHFNDFREGMQVSNRVKDSSPRNSLVDVLGGPKSSRGRFGEAIMLGNLPDKADVVQVRDFQFSSPSLTFSLWIKGTAGGRFIFSYSAATENDNLIGLHDLSNLKLILFKTQNFVLSNVPLNDGRWHHLGLVLEYRAPANASVRDGQYSISFYQDGSLQRNSFLSDVGAPAMRSGGCLALGQDQDTACGGYQLNQAFQGEIDEFAVFSRALSAEEIKNHYLRGALQASYQVRSCPDPLCENSLFRGPSDLIPQYEDRSPLNGSQISFALNLPRARYFQYSVTLGRDPRVEVAPVITEVTVDPPHVFAGPAFLVALQPIPFLKYSIHREVTLWPTCGISGYQVSANLKDWYFTIGGQWLQAVSPDSTNSLAEIGVAWSNLSQVVTGQYIYIRLKIQSTFGQCTPGIKSLEFRRIAITSLLDATDKVFRNSLSQDFCHLNSTLSATHSRKCVVGYQKYSPS